MTIIRITEEDRQRAAEVRRERIERDELMMLICQWLQSRVGHDGPVTVSELTAPPLHLTVVQVPTPPPPLAADAGVTPRGDRRDAP